MMHDDDDDDDDDDISSYHILFVRQYVQLKVEHVLIL